MLPEIAPHRISTTSRTARAFTGTYGELSLETQGIVLVGKRSIPFKMDYRLLQAD
jgi:hypothetical protein